MADDFDRKLRRWREAAEIAGIVGSPAQIPQMRVVPLKEKLVPLRIYVRGLPEAQAAAVHAAITRAEEKSVQICEACGRQAACAKRATATVTRARERHVLD
jgi:hypothetical protein